MASADRKALVRNKIADYIKVGDKFELMGTGFKSVMKALPHRLIQLLTSMRLQALPILSDMRLSSLMKQTTFLLRRPLPHYGRMGVTTAPEETRSMSIFVLICIILSVTLQKQQRFSKPVNSSWRTRFPIMREMVERRYLYPVPCTLLATLFRESLTQ